MRRILIAVVMMLVMVANVAHAELIKSGTISIPPNSKVATYIVKVIDIEKEKFESFHCLSFDCFLGKGIKYVVPFGITYQPAGWPRNPTYGETWSPIKVNLQLQEKAGDKWKTITSFTCNNGMNQQFYTATSYSQDNKLAKSNNYRFLLENTSKYEYKVFLLYDQKFKK